MILKMSPLVSGSDPTSGATDIRVSHLIKQTLNTTRGLIHMSTFLRLKFHKSVSSMIS